MISTLSLVLGIYIGITIAVLLLLEIVLFLSETSIVWHLLSVLISILWLPTVVFAGISLLIVYLITVAESSESRENRKFLPKDLE